MQSGRSPENSTLPLPPELVLHVFSFFTPKHLAVVSRVSKETEALAEDNRLWFSLFKPTSKAYEESKNYKLLYQLREKQQLHQRLAVALNLNRPGLLPNKRAPWATLQANDFADIYCYLTETEHAALCTAALPSALIGALVFETQLLEDKQQTRTRFYGQITQNLTKACSGKGLSIADKLKHIADFLALAENIPDEPLKLTAHWQDKKTLLADIQKVKESLEAVQRERCTMPY